jgi:hypothetical protein
MQFPLKLYFWYVGKRWRPDFSLVIFDILTADILTAIAL